jgi:hypothetical protein
VKRQWRRAEIRKVADSPPEKTDPRREKAVAAGRKKKSDK